MKRMESLLLGAALALAAVVGAQAADLPNAKGSPAAEYVKVCKEGGLAGFAIPGSDACLRVSGFVDAEIGMGRPASAYWPSSGAPLAASRQAGDIGYFTRGQIDFDAVTNTAEGPLLAHVDLRAGAGDRNFDWDSARTGLGEAYVQWNGFTAGRHRSFFWGQ